MMFIVGVVVVAAIALQLTLLRAINQAAARAKVAVREGSASITSDAETNDKFFWRAWCRECDVGGPRFAAGGAEALVAKVRSWWETLGPLIVLQRLGVMAPLMGVIFTAFGLLNLKPPTDEGTAAILGAMTPFGLGIGGGALIAILNQCVLLLSEFVYRDTEAVVKEFVIKAGERSLLSGDLAAMASLPPELQLFFDRLTCTIGPLTGALENATCHLDRSQSIQKSCHDVLESLAAGIRQLEEQATRQQRATDAYVDSIEKVVLPSQKQMQTTSKRINDVAIALAAPLEGFLKATERLVAGYETAAEGMQAFQTGTQAFARVIDEDFVPSAEKHRTAAKDLETMVVRSRQAADGFVAGITRFAKSFEYQHEVTDRIVAMIDQQAAPAYELLAKSARTLESSTAALAEHAEGFRSAVLEQIALNQRLQESSETAVAALADAGQSLATNTTKIFVEPVVASTKLLDRFEALPRNLDPFIASLRTSTEALSTTCHAQDRTAVATESSLAATKAAADKLIAMATGLEANIAILTRAAHSAGDLYSRFDTLTDGHAIKIREASEPLVERLSAVAEAVKKLSVDLNQPKQSMLGRLLRGS
jgi:hypothetical protein